MSDSSRIQKGYFNGRVPQDVDPERFKHAVEPGDFVIETAKGRVGDNPSELEVHIDQRGHVRVDCTNNPPFWLEFQLPKYIVDAINNAEHNATAAAPRPSNSDYHSM